MRVTRAVLALPVAAAVAVGAGGAFADSGVSAAARCGLNDATLGYSGSEGAAGTQIEKFQYFAKNGGVHCSMKGYAKITLLEKSGTSLPIKVKRSHNRPVRRLTLKKGKPVAFELAHPSFDPVTTKPCKIKVWGMRVETPGFSKVLVLKLSSPLRFCDTGAKRTAFGRKR